MSVAMMAHAHKTLTDVLANLTAATGTAYPGKRRLKSGKIDSALLNTLATSNSSKALLNNVASTRIANIRNPLRDSRSLSPGQTREKAAELLLWTLLLTRTRTVPNVIPLQHHWVPLCYTKAFGVRNRKNRGVMIGQSRFNIDGKVEKEHLVPDTFFAHPKSKTGYYKVHTEMFFAHIEGYYSMERPDSEETWSDWSNVVMLAFFAMQAARNPAPSHSHANARFHKDHQSHIIHDMFAALDAFTNPHIAYVFDGLEFMFTPFFPPRIRFLVDGTRVAVFSLSPEKAFVLSDRALTTVEASIVAERNAEAMVKHAIRSGQPLYGLARAEIK